MKTAFFILFLSFISNISGNAFAQTVSNLCPQKVIVVLDCAKENGDFQLVRHLGRYSNPKMEFTPDGRQMVCSFAAAEWVSKYRLGRQNERTVSVSSLPELVQVADVIRKKGFNFEKVTRNPEPFAMITYRQSSDRYTQDQFFLFSGLESTFGSDHFTVSTAGPVSTVIVNDKYLKSQNAAADTFVTGSNCVVSIK